MAGVKVVVLRGLPLGGLAKDSVLFLCLHLLASAALLLLEDNLLLQS